RTSILKVVKYNQAIKSQGEIWTEFELHYNDNAAGQSGQQNLQKQDELKAYNIRVRKAMHQYSLSKGSFAIVDKGRSINEQSVILFIKDKLKGYGFFELNHQLNNLEILQSIITPIEDSKIVRYYIEHYLRKKPNLKIIQLETQKITH